MFLSKIFVSLQAIVKNRRKYKEGKSERQFNRRQGTGKLVIIIANSKLQNIENFQKKTLKTINSDSTKLNNLSNSKLRQVPSRKLYISPNMTT